MADEHQASLSSRRALGKRARWALMATASVALYAVIGFFVIPPILRSKLESTLTNQLNHPVSIGEIRLNPFALSITVRAFDITEPDQTPLLGFEELYVNVQLASLINRALTFSEIRLLHPYAVVKIRKDGTLNLADLHPPATDQPVEPAPPREEQPLPGVIVELLQHEGGVLEFHDESKPTPFSADIVPISFTLQNFSTRPDSADALRFTAEIGPGERIEWHGAVHIQPLDSEGRLSITGLKARTLWSYIQDRVNFEFMDGAIDVSVLYRIRSTPDAFEASLSEGAVKLTQLALGEKGFREQQIVVPEFAVEGIDADLGTRAVKIAEVRSRDARITGWIERDGSTSFQRLFAGERQEKTAPAPPPSPTPAPAAAPPWLVTINRISLDKYGITVEDRTPATPVRLAVDPLALTVTNVSSRLDAKFSMDLSARVNDAGTVAVKGDVIADPLQLNLDVDVGNIALAPFQPYIDRIAHLRLKTGSAGISGHLAYGPQPNTKAKMRFDGKAGILELLTKDTLLDKDFVRWSGLLVNGISLELDPTSLSITEILSTRPYARFIIGPDRTTNVHEIFAKPEAGSTAEPPPVAQSTPSNATQPMPVRIGVIRIVDGSAHFADFSIKPVIDTGIFALNGTIKGLSSKDLSKADVSIEGKVDKYAPMAIKGVINPLSGDAFTDIAVTFKNVELTTVSPYATKFAGYPITKGKISLDLRYKLAKKLLEAENNVLIEQLTLGNRVEGPDATSLPVKLAVALLKDRNGNIDIDLPVRGDLNDPDFKYGKVLIGVLMNLLTKAVTSPFNLVAGLVGGSGEELSLVNFAPGSGVLAQPEEAKLTTLAKALVERPGLRLDIAGAADRVQDRNALAEQHVNSQLLALRTAGPKPADQSGTESEDFTRLPEADQLELVKALYLKTYGKLPEPVPGSGPGDKPLVASTQTLKDRLRADIVIDEGEIRLLAQQRGKRIQDYLASQGGVPPERIYLMDVKLDAQAKDGFIPINLNLNAN